MSIAVVIQHAMDMRRIVLPSVTSLAPPYLRGKKLTERKTCAFIFSTILSETFLILGRPERDIVINVRRSLCKVPVILVRF